MSWSVACCGAGSARVGIYERINTIAVVGASADGAKTANVISSCLPSQGYQIISVNPGGGEILGARTYDHVDLPVDVVDVFRPPAEALAVAREAIAKGVGVLWFQPATHTDEAACLAADAGLTVVTGIHMGALHAPLGLGPGPSTSSGYWPPPCEAHTAFRKRTT